MQPWQPCKYPAKRLDSKLHYEQLRQKQHAMLRHLARPCKYPAKRLDAKLHYERLRQRQHAMLRHLARPCKCAPNARMLSSAMKAAETRAACASSAYGCCNARMLRTSGSPCRLLRYKPVRISSGNIVTRLAWPAKTVLSRKTSETAPSKAWCKHRSACLKSLCGARSFNTSLATLLNALCDTCSRKPWSRMSLLCFRSCCLTEFWCRCDASGCSPSMRSAPLTATAVSCLAPGRRAFESWCLT